MRIISLQKLHTNDNSNRMDSIQQNRLHICSVVEISLLYLHLRPIVSLQSIYV